MTNVKFLFIFRNYLFLNNELKICRGRVEQYNPNYSRQLEAILQDAPGQFTGSGHGNPMMMSHPSTHPSSGAIMIPRPSQPSLGGTPKGSPC